MAVWSRPERFADREADALAGGGVGLVVLGERVHRADRLAVQVDEGEGMATLNACDLLQVAVPQVQEPLAILWQEPVRLLVIGRIVHATLPAGMPSAHQLSAGNEAELLGEILRPIAFARASQLVAPVGRRGTVTRVVDKGLGLARIG